jgi:hypothetical protein
MHTGLRFLSENEKGRGYFGDLREGGRIILKLTFKKSRYFDSELRYFWNYKPHDSLDGGSVHRKASSYIGLHNRGKRGYISMSSADSIRNPGLRAIQDLVLIYDM